MTTDTSKITGAADELSAGLAKGGTAAKTLGAEIANAFKSLDDRVTAIEAGGTTPPVEPPIEPPIEPPPANTYGKIENFNGSNGSSFKVDSATCSAQNANQPHCVTKVDDYTLRFEARQADIWSTSSGYSDSGCNRTELEFHDRYNEGVMMNWEGTVTVLAGPLNAQAMLVQSHAVTNVNPTYCPFSFKLEHNTEKLMIVLQEPNNGWNMVYRSPNAVVHGQPMRLRAKVKMGPKGNGYVGAWWDDKQIVDFNGKVGATNSQYYWKYGVYRDQVPEVSKVDFKNIHITTG
jgi:hypothetical protein